jgi:hypothetical protein
VLFTGISASIKAEKNLEKARATYAEAEAAVEKMKVSETLCDAITEKSEMFDELLVELDQMFSECISLLDRVVRKKEGRFFKKKLTSNDFSEDELALIAVTGSLAKAVKTVIDTPILSENGKISSESQEMYAQTKQQLPAFSEKVEEVKAIDYHIESIAPAESKSNDQKTSYKPSSFVKSAMWFLSFIPAYAGTMMFFSSMRATSVAWILAGLLMCPLINKKNAFFASIGTSATCNVYRNMSCIETAQFGNEN